MLDGLYICGDSGERTFNQEMSFNFSTSESIANFDSMHIGSGIPTLLPYFNCEDDQCEARSCSSMCSAASTVASAFSSIEASISFPSTASTVSFDLATNVAKQLSENSLARRRACEIQRPAKSCNKGRSHPYEKRSEKLTTVQTNGISAMKASLDKNNDTPFEEFSLGAGDPWKTNQ